MFTQTSLQRVKYTKKDLRPIEEFRHTPVVPISEKDLSNYKKKIQEKNRKGVYFEIKKQTLIYYSYGLFGFIIIYFVFRYMEKEAEKTHSEIERLRLLIISEK